MNSKSKRVRSPAYPAISLDVALKKIQDLYKEEGRNEAFLNVAVSHLGYSPTSGSGLKAVAALSSYGLVDAIGSGKNRKIKLTKLALQIILDNRENSLEKIKLIQEVALKPKIHQKLWQLWGPNLPSIENTCHHLVFEEGFNEKFVTNFVKDYYKTIKFAQLRNTGVVEENTTDDDTESEIVADNMMTPKQESSNSTLPTPKNKPKTIPLSETEVEIAKFPVAKNCTIRIIANGSYNRKAIEALVAQLELNLKLGVFDDEASSEG